MVVALGDWIERFCFLLFGFISCLEAATTHCDPGWVYNAGRCYFFNLTEGWEQPQAKTECANQNATLVMTIRDLEDRWLRDYLNATYEMGGLTFWSGLESEPNTNRTFKWNACPLDFDEWHESDPNGSPEHHMCVRYLKWDTSDDVRMADRRCFNTGRMFGFICEKPGVRVLDNALNWGGTARPSKLSGSFRIEQEIQADSKTECFIHCAKEVGCEAFSYNEETKMCRILTIACDGDQHENKLPWETYEMH